MTQREPVIERLISKLLLCPIFVALQQCRQPFRRIPAVQSMAEVIRTSQVTEPDAAACRQLP
jgi:hypothetical protein